MEEWTAEGPRITDPDALSRIQQLIEGETDIIVEHRSLRGARAPHRFVCEDFAIFEDYVRNQASPGDSFYVWGFEACCTDANVCARGKVPDWSGKTPVGGPY